MTRYQLLILASTAILSLWVLFASWPGVVMSSGPREIRIHARQYAYDPGVLRVRQGERITIAFEADDVTHGLYLESYDEDQ